VLLNGIRGKTKYLPFALLWHTDKQTTITNQIIGYQ
jgi:hypothetical protein